MQENAIKEVEHLQRLQHSLIARAIGTYTIGKDLSYCSIPSLSIIWRSLLVIYMKAQDPRARQDW